MPKPSIYEIRERWRPVVERPGPPVYTFDESERSEFGWEWCYVPCLKKHQPAISNAVKDVPALLDRMDWLEELAIELRFQNERIRRQQESLIWLAKKFLAVARRKAAAGATAAFTRVVVFCLQLVTFSVKYRRPR